MEPSCTQLEQESMRGAANRSPGPRWHRCGSRRLPNWAGCSCSPALLAAAAGWLRCCPARLVARPRRAPSRDPRICASRSTLRKRQTGSTLDGVTILANQPGCGLGLVVSCRPAILMPKRTASAASSTSSCHGVSKPFAACTLGEWRA